MIVNKSWPNGTHVKSASYDTQAEELTVHFNTDSYLYYDVTAEEWEQISNADSGGKIINAIIKGNHEYDKL